MNWGNQDDVVAAFFDGSDGPYEASNLFFEEAEEARTLYSYGHHFWLAIKRNDGVVFVNGERYSNSTAKQRRKVQRYAPGHSLTVSMSAFNRANVDPYKCRVLDNIRDQRGVFNDYYLKGDEIMPAAKDFLKTAPDEATVFNKTMELKGKKVTIPMFWHIAASILIRDEGRLFLCGQDENQYFMVRLPTTRTQKIDKALTDLQPKQVKKAYAEGKEVCRQGEWFFIDTGVEGKEAKKIYANMGREFNLTGADGGRGAGHICTRGYKRGRSFLVSGQVRHSRGEHRMLKLSLSKNPKIFKAYRNTAIQNWSMGGNVD